MGEPALDDMIWAVKGVLDQRVWSREQIDRRSIILRALLTMLKTMKGNA